MPGARLNVTGPGGAIKADGCIEEAAVARKIIQHPGLPAEPLPTTPVQALLERARSGPAWMSRALTDDVLRQCGVVVPKFGSRGGLGSRVHTATAAGNSRPHQRTRL